MTHWTHVREQVEALADALAPHLDAEEALMVAEWIVQNPEAAEAAAYEHFGSHDCNEIADGGALAHVAQGVSVPSAAPDLDRAAPVGPDETLVIW